MARGTAYAIEAWAKASIAATRGIIGNAFLLQELSDSIVKGSLFVCVEGGVETTCAGRSWARAWVLRLASLGLYERDCAGKDKKQQIRFGEAHFRSPFSGCGAVLSGLGHGPCSTRWGTMAQYSSSWSMPTTQAHSVRSEARC
jgi:hypothetical protein